MTSVKLETLGMGVGCVCGGWAPEVAISRGTVTELAASGKVKPEYRKSEVVRHTKPNSPQFLSK